LRGFSATDEFLHQLV